MQGFKKTLVALLAVAMVLSLVGPVFAAPADVAGTKYEDAAVRLIALGIFKGDDKGNFNPDAPISRAEATAVIIRALGLGKSADLMNGVTKFADVNADAGLQWATGAVNVAVSSNIINGYPNGQFGGRDNVTYAQLAKMILYALNYGVVVEGGVWPTAVLAKADDLDILDGMTVVADAPITRGDAAKMLDNSLDVNALRQFGYGDLQQYAEDGKTLLERMGLDEIEGRVVEIPEVEDALDADEVTIDLSKVNGEKKTGEETYTQLAGVDVQSLFGLEVKAWVKDDEVVFVEKKTADKDIFVDTIEEVKGNDKVLLTVLDDTVNFLNTVDEEATIYVNNNPKDVDDITVAKNDEWAGYFGRFVRKDNKIVFAYLFDFDNNGVVTSVDGEKVKYFTTTDKVRTLDLSDADAVYVYNADLTKSDLDEIEEDDVAYWWEDDDEFYIVVASEKAEGTLEKIKGTKVTIEGKGYTFDGDEKATYSVDNDKTVKIWANSAGDLDDLYDEEVVALLDLNGHVRHLRGNVKATSGTQYGVVVGASSDSKAIVFTKDGEDVTYEIAKKSDWDALDAPESKKYYRRNNELGYFVLAYKLDADGEIAETSGDVGVRAAKPVVYVFDDPDYVAQEETAGTPYEHVIKAKKGDRTITWGSGGSKYYIDQDTVVIRTVNSKGELDPEVIAWDDFKDLVLVDNAENEVKNQAVVFGEVGKAAKAIFFVNKAFAGAQDDVYYGIVTDTWRADAKNWVEVDVFDEGKVEYVVNTGSFSKGEIAVFRLNAKGELVETTVAGVDEDEDFVWEVDGYYATVGITKVKFEADAVTYTLDEDDDLDKKIDAADIDEFDYIEYVAKDGVVKAIVKWTSMSKTDRDIQDMVDAVAEGIAATFGATGAVDDVKMPDVPAGYTIKVKSSSAAAVYSAEGKIVTDGDSNVVYTVTHTASGKTANTGTVVVTVTVAP